jgi:hypothetical protein
MLGPWRAVELKEINYSGFKAGAFRAGHKPDFLRRAQLIC